MSKIIKRLYPEVIKKTAARCRQRGLRIPTFKELRHPELIPPSVTSRLKGVGLWDVNPVNLFRITCADRTRGKREIMTISLTHLLYDFRGGYRLAIRWLWLALWLCAASRLVGSAFFCHDLRGDLRPNQLT